MTNGERTRALRKALGLTTTQLGDAIGLSNSGISSIERDVRNLTDKHIRLICAAYPQVNENWLRTGEGEMFMPISEQKDEISELCAQYGLGGMVASMLRSYMSLDLQHKQMIHDWLMSWYDDFKRTAKHIGGGDDQAADDVPSDASAQTDADADFIRQVREARARHDAYLAAQDDVQDKQA